MNPVEPTFMHDGGKLVVFAKDQPEYIPLPASVDDKGLVMTEWEPTAEELEKLFVGGRVRLWIYKGNSTTCENCGNENATHLSPVRIEAIEPECGMRENK